MRWIAALALFCWMMGCSSKEPLENSASPPNQEPSPAPKPPAKQISKENETLQYSIKKTKPYTLPDKTEKAPAPRKKVVLNVPLISQNPELKYGCEVTSLSMVLQYAGIKAGKLELADKVKKDNDPLTTTKTGDITHWGDPEDGFVGDMTGKGKGYAVYVKPLQQLMEHYLPDRTVNLTKHPFDELLNQVRKGNPVIVWTTGDFKQPDRWESWNHGQERITTPLDLHVVVLVGFEPNYVYVNDPLAVRKTFKVDKQTFINSWAALGRQALSYR